MTTDTRARPDAAPSDTSARLLPVPDLPDAAPTLAKHLAQALRLNRALMPCVNGISEGQIADHNAAVEALSRIAHVAADARIIDGVEYWRDDGGALVPVANIPAKIKLQHDYVASIASAALQLHSSLARFKALAMGEGQALIEVLGQDYGVKLDDASSVSFFTFDRVYRVQIASADRISFGPEIQSARALLEQWVREEEGSPALKMLINRAFGLDQEGKIRASEVFRLASYEMPGATWAKAMQAIRDSVIVVGKAAYLRVYRRGPDGKEALIPLDLASV